MSCPPGLLTCRQAPPGDPEGKRKNLTRVLEATINGPSDDRIPAPDYSTASTDHRGNGVAGGTPAIFTPLRRRGSRHQDYSVERHVHGIGEGTSGDT